MRLVVGLVGGLFVGIVVFAASAFIIGNAVEGTPYQTPAMIGCVVLGCLAFVSTLRAS